MLFSGMSPAAVPLVLALQDPPAWMVEGLFWLLAAVAAGVLAIAVGLWLLLIRVRRIEELGRRVDAVEDLRSIVSRIAAAREDLDLRRLEHVLIDLRDGQREVHDALLRNIEASARSQVDGVAGAASQGLGERAVNRLHSLGYERVHLVDAPEEVDELVDGEVQVEAHRQGVLHKGRVVVRSGRIFAVDLKSVYTAFP